MVTAFHADRREYGVLPGGARVDEYTLTSPYLTLQALTLGGIITAIRVPDRDGRRANVVLAHDGLRGYLENTPYFGAIVGRYANRIARGRFSLDGRVHTLSINNGPHHLHGGACGFDRQLWNAGTIERPDSVAVVFSRTSADGEEGYPGTLRVSVTYLLTADGDLVIDYRAETDAPTIVNLTQHTYFNLSDADEQIGDHELTIAAAHYTPVDAGLIPTGELAPVAATPFDFRTSIRIGARIDAPHAQLRHAGGYDHNWVLDPGRERLVHAATLRSPGSGRALEVWTDQPGVQFYSGNFLQGRVAGADGRSLGYRAGCCLETQHFPDSPNQPAFPSTVLRPGSALYSRTIWRFSPS